nr:Silicon transporter [Eleusine coracana]
MLIELPKLAATLVFFLTWILILPQKWKYVPLGRSISALFGASLLMTFQIISIPEAFSFVYDGMQVLALLFGLMILSNYCDKEGFFDIVEKSLTKHCQTGSQLVLRIILISGILSALLTNDAVCIFITASVVRISKRYGLNTTTLLIALGTSSNIGSAATLSGNPQNAYIGIQSGIPYLTFVSKLGIVSLIGLLANYGCIWIYDPKTMRQCLKIKDDKGEAQHHTEGIKLGSPEDDNVSLLASKLKQEDMSRGSASLKSTMKVLVALMILGVLVLFLLGFNLAMVSIGGALWVILLEAVLLRYEPKPVVEAVDYQLLIFFSGLFIVVGAMTNTGYPQALWNFIFDSVDVYSIKGIILFSVIVLVASNMISNVPAVILATPLLLAMSNAKLAWMLLAWVSTIGGNLTVIGSAAMIIVAERAAMTDKTYTLSSLKYMVYGVPSTLIIVSLGVPVLYGLDQIY